MTRLSSSAFVPMNQVKQMAKRYSEALSYDLEVAKIEILFGETWAPVRMWLSYSQLFYTLK